MQNQNKTQTCTEMLHSQLLLSNPIGQKLYVHEQYKGSNNLFQQYINLQVIVTGRVNNLLL